MRRWRWATSPTHNWNLLAGDLTAPVAVLRKSALEHNARWMRHLLDKFGLQLAPHAKTTMTPHLWAQQAAHGCWGLTVATVQQAEVAAAFGCRNVLIANQVTGRSQVRGIVELNHAHAALEIYVLVDSIAGLKALSDDVAAAKTEHPVNVLLEVRIQGRPHRLPHARGGQPAARRIAAPPGPRAARRHGRLRGPDRAAERRRGRPARRSLFRPLRAKPCSWPTGATPS